MFRVLAALVLSVLLSGPAGADTLATGQGPVQAAPVVAGLKVPWALAVLPDGGVLVTERGGRLLMVQGGRARPIAGVPRVATNGQGGLMDVMIPRDFAESRQIYLSFAKAQGQGAGTALASATLSADATRLANVRVIFEAAQGSTGGRHFGSRIVEATDGTLFLTLGERGNDASAQDLGNHNGAVIRINRDGSVPGDNPFVGTPGARPEIWSYGHRNPQGAALDARGRLWLSEHGAKGGDEINRSTRGANYGWPVIAYGRHYSGAKIGEGTAKPGMQQPQFYWDPSIAPSGMIIYSGKLWPQWRGHFLVGSLKFDMISHLAGSPLREVERIKGPETNRVRDIIEAPDGAIWFISEGNGTVYRMTPG